MSRGQFLGTAAGLVASATAPADAPAGQENKRPNVLLILVDDLGYGDLACYGAQDLCTPNVDALAASGIRFTRFYSNCPVCSPTRASVLTGRYPDAVGVPGVIRTHRDNSWGKLAEDAALLPTVLEPAGYNTAIVGKWHLGLASPDTPTERGFGFFHGFLGDMMDDYYTHRRHGNNYMRRNRETIDPEGHATDLFSQWAIDYIHDQAREEAPFFLYLAYNAPHTPIQPPDEWVERVTQRQPGIDPERARIAALIEHLDDGVGRVLAALDETGQGDNTLVIFASDNGGQDNVGADNAGLHGAKQDMFEGGIRVPMCASWPGHVLPHPGIAAVAMTMDLFPTVCEACGAPFSHTIDGVSLIPILTGSATGTGERTLFWVRREGGPHYGGRDYYAARRGPWKLLQNTPFEPMALYNLDEDPLEERPIGTDHAMYKRLFQELRGHINDVGTVPWQRPAGQDVL